jgi:hypothetical protein
MSHSTVRAFLVCGTLAFTCVSAQDFPHDACKSPHYVEASQREISHLAMTYSECVRTSDGTHDCSAEFTELKAWQDGFVTAVGLFKERQKLGACD